MIAKASVLAAVLSFVPWTLHAEPIVIDGLFEDWARVPVSAELAAPPQRGGAPRLLRVKHAATEDRVGILLELNREEQAAKLPDIEVLFDTDRDAATGVAAGDLGADVIWSLARSDAQVWILGVPLRSPPAGLGLRRSPTVSSTRFEISFDRTAAVAGGPLFAPGEMFVVIRDGAGRLTPKLTIPASATLPKDPDGKPAVLERQLRSHLRVLTYNVLFDGLFKRTPAFGRILRALDPDVIVFQEIFTHGAQQTRDLVRELLPEEEWHAAGSGRGGVLVSRLPILDEGETGGPRRGLWARLAKPNDSWRHGPLILEPRPPCCEDEAGRQVELDATMAWLRKARENGTIAEGTPLIVAGDMNLVGYAHQLTTLLHGEIRDEEVFGATFAPDWDGTGLADAMPYHTGGTESYTWREDGSPFPPGRLDYIVYSDSVLRLGNRFVLWTPDMSAVDLKSHGLQREDTRTASDHLPVVADFFPPDSGRSR